MKSRPICTTTTKSFSRSVLTVSDTFDHLTPSDDESGARHRTPACASGRYVVLERLGVGGMGHVYLGDDTRLHRKVALKCLIASASSGDLRSRILHEARAAARINHPNIAVVHDVVEHDGRPFLVMEYVEGENLAAVLRRERPAVDTILLDGPPARVRARRPRTRKGIIHRDLKPANIQVTPDGSVKILDFGVAQAMSVAVDRVRGEHDGGRVMPLSTSPTLRSGRGADRCIPARRPTCRRSRCSASAIDQRSDIYSLGVVMLRDGDRPSSVLHRQPARRRAGV